MNDHPNKHIRAAIDQALDGGWLLRKAGPTPTFGAGCIAPLAYAAGA